MEKKFRITVDGNPYVVTVEDISEGASLLYPEPGSMTVPTAKAAPAASAAPAPKAAAAPARGPAGDGDVVSSLAGVVESVAVSVGQSVAQGDKVATVEAMKMKTPIIAHRAGKVASIAVKPGDPVEPGQTLLLLG
ncbi:MAG: acetyl-CoA carboxylase biotin carboxyl carrier protein subunit [Sterolibacteriaceae bacterium]|nr:acetyl-CoA carboxylase biotin carboxyl carrier protein subunit [Sterolibacteriaceae bacterium]